MGKILVAGPNLHRTLQIKRAGSRKCLKIAGFLRNLRVWRRSQNPPRDTSGAEGCPVSARTTEVLNGDPESFPSSAEVCTYIGAFVAPYPCFGPSCRSGVPFFFLDRMFNWSIVQFRAN